MQYVILQTAHVKTESTYLENTHIKDGVASASTESTYLEKHIKAICTWPLSTPDWEIGRRNANI